MQSLPGYESSCPVSPCCLTGMIKEGVHLSYIESYQITDFCVGSKALSQLLRPSFYYSSGFSFNSCRAI